MVIEELSLAPDIKAQLLCAKTGKRTPLSPVYDLMVAREAGDWERVTHTGETAQAVAVVCGGKRRMKPSLGAPSHQLRGRRSALLNRAEAIPFDDTFAAGRAGLGAKGEAE